ncbi:MAG: hypothetical protein IJC26_02345 [Clostridia bacterium]|nr:hypothetical protein [Clostridia bacterium]
MKNVMKILISAMLIAVFLTSLASCKESNAAPSPDVTETESKITTELKTTEEAIATEEEKDSAEKEDSAETEKIDPPQAPAVTQQQAPVLYDTAYYNSKEGSFSDPYVPNLTLREDGSFVLVENLAAGMGTYQGSYTMADNQLILSVASINFSGFAGDGVSTIVFTVNSQNSLTLQTTLCLSMSGDVFLS